METSGMVAGTTASTSVDEDRALRLLVEGTAAETGARFFAALVQSLALALGTHGAWVTEYLPAPRRLRALAFWLNGRWVSDYEYSVSGTPCEPVVEQVRLVHIPENVVALYPRDPDLRQLGAVSYAGVPLVGGGREVLGHLAVLDVRPMPEEPRAVAVMRIFAARAAAELQRLRAEAGLREREEKLRRLVSGAMDAIIELDAAGRVTLCNEAAEKVFRCRADEMVGREFASFLSAAGAAKLAGLTSELGGGAAERRRWIAGGLEARTAEGEAFPAEATVSHIGHAGRAAYLLVLRDVNERLEAERRLQALTQQTEYLREELRAVRGAEMLGESAAFRQVLRDVAQVAATNATVLLLGETGTGKELVARAIHGASKRRDAALVRVNCAAIPAALIESEFFGHEKGGFTGATRRREGRFALAHGGTIFLDEVGELPLELQPKLLRVLQEGEFELVGSSETRRVDVRVIAATNRDLAAAVRAGTFREDLYYRLSVFPIRLPPLRERPDDIPLLAAAFARRYALDLGRPVAPPSGNDVRRLQAYAWPGNVRELQNVIERAVITGTDGRLNLDRALPGEVPAPPAPVGESPDRIRTVQELEALERDNLLRALESSGWRIAGEKGAARLLNIHPNTLASRLRALGITRPRP
jgi:PAS domain S-box-containing protein